MSCEEASPVAAPSAAAASVPTAHLMQWPAIHEHVARIRAAGSSAPPRLCVVASCGSYNPISTAHVAMLEAAWHYLTGHLQPTEGVIFEGAPAGTEPPKHFVAVGALVSPVSDYYNKPDLGPYAHRRALCELALRDRPWAAVDTFEGTQPHYERTYTVLKHMQDGVAAHYRATASTDEERALAAGLEVCFLCGGDLFETFYRAGVWELGLLERIFREFHLLVVARVGSKDPLLTIAEQEAPLVHPASPEVALDLRTFCHKVHVLRIPPNETSSTKIREALRAGASVDGMVPPACAAYLATHNVFK